MKNIITVSVLVCFNIVLLMGVLLITTPSFSYNMVKGVADEEVYEIIDSMVAETPHVNMVLDSMPEKGTTIMTISADSPQFLQGMIEEGIMYYFPLLDGYVEVVFEYGGEIAAAVMTITQVEQ